MSSSVGVFELRLAPAGAEQLKDLTVEATLSWEECCDPFRLSDESRLFMASNDFLRSAMVNDDDLCRKKLEFDYNTVNAFVCS